MKPVPLPASCLILAAALLLAGAPALAQDRIYRCPNNEYTNQIKGRTDCKPVKDDGNITIIHSSPAPAKSGSSPASTSRVDPAEQRAKDADAKAILENELQKAQARQAELEKQYNNGQPDKIGGEAKNYQKYIDRVGEMKTAIERNQSDIEGIKRELARYQNQTPPASNPAP